jgi:hypothetical protein
MKFPDTLKQIPNDEIQVTETLGDNGEIFANSATENPQLSK